jgi:hypothetical protein
MEGKEKPDTDKYEGIANDWNYDASCRLTSLLIWDLENFKQLIFVAQSVHGNTISHSGELKELTYIRLNNL